MIRVCNLAESLGVTDPATPLKADPIHVFTLVDAQRVCTEELLKDYPDYDRIAEARLLVEELEGEKAALKRPEPDPTIVHRRFTNFRYTFFYGGLVLLVCSVLSPVLEPEIIFVAAAMMGLPAFVR